MWNGSLAANNFVLWTIDSLNSGVYSIELIDANNCQYFDTVSLFQPDSLSMTIIEYTDTCSRGVGKAIVNVNGGVSPYNYLWSNGSTSSTI